MGKNNGLLSNLRYDLPASIVVFLVALPLCMGIALGSEAPNLFTGIIAGIVGGIVVGAISKSHVSVSGPAAGLTMIVASGIHTLNSFEVFLAAVVVAGAVQLLLGIARAGVLGSFFPVSVIKGMLAAIGLTLILKQIPHFVGYDKDYEGDESFTHHLNRIFGEENTFTELLDALVTARPGAVLIGLISLGLLILWGTKLIRQNRILSLIPAPLLVVFLAIGMNVVLGVVVPGWQLGPEHLVQVPIPTDFTAFKSQFMSPDFSQIMNMDFIIVAFTIAIVASLESLLSIDAADKLDPQRRITPSSRELVAQGSGNIVSGLLGGLPVTAVIVRSSANIASGARSKMSAILHGIWLLLAVILIPRYLNLIPLAALAAILLQVGFKLIKPSLFVEMKKKGWNQFIPFVVTIVAIMFTNLLVGILIGMAFGIFFVIRTNYHSAIQVIKDGNGTHIRFNRDASFVNKLALRNALAEIKEGSNVVVEIPKDIFVDQDIHETIEDFISMAKYKNIQVELKN